MKKVYESPSAEVIDLMAQEQIALIEDPKASKSDNVTDGSQFVDDNPFG